MEELLEKGTAGQPHPATSIYTPICIQQQLLKHLREQQTQNATWCILSIGPTSNLAQEVIDAATKQCTNKLALNVLHLWYIRFRLLNEKLLGPTLMPLSQLTHRSPLVRKQATACRARWWIQPSCLSCVMMASIQGKPVRPSAHLASASGFWSQGIWRHVTRTRQERGTDYMLFFHSTGDQSFIYISLCMHLIDQNKFLIGVKSFLVIKLILILLKVKLSPKCNQGFICDWIWAKPLDKWINMTKEALLRFTIASVSGKLILNGSARGRDTMTSKSLFLEN